MKKLLIVSAIVIGAVAVRADQTMSSGSSAFQASLTPNIAVHSSTTEIRGFAINIWGENPQHAFNLGIVNGSTGDSSGFSWAMYNYDDSYTGVQWGIVNFSKENFKGWQSGMVNYSKGDVRGLQNGIVNYAEHLHGVQLGLINIAENNDWFKGMPDKFAKGFPFFNWSF